MALQPRPCATCDQPFQPGSANAKYCPKCKASGKNTPRVKTSLRTTVRLAKGLNLNLNMPLFKLKI